jgi:toxin ParE1/3/4
MPYIGVMRKFKQSRLRNLRQWPVKEFEVYLIFYRVTNKRIDVIRILHGRRDLEAIFSKRN